MILSRQEMRYAVSYLMSREADAIAREIPCTDATLEQAAYLYVQSARVGLEAGPRDEAGWRRAVRWVEGG